MADTHDCIDTCEPGARRSLLAIDIIPFNALDLRSACKYCSQPRIDEYGNGCCRDCSVKYTMPGKEAPTVEMLAHVMGIGGTEEFSYDEHMNRVKNIRVLISAQGSDFEHLIYTRFCACYLPQFIELFLKNQERRREDTVHAQFEACTILFGHLYENRYFAKFMLSQHPNAIDGNDLAMLISRWLILDGRTWTENLSEPGSATPVQAILNNLCDLLYVFMCLLLDKPDNHPSLCGPRRAELLPFLRKWAMLFERVSGRMSALKIRRVLSLVMHEQQAVERALLKKYQLEGLQSCASPGCEAPGIWQCGRCKTTVYCGRKHQREHWHAGRIPHKAVCYATNF